MKLTKALDKAKKQKGRPASAKVISVKHRVRDNDWQPPVYKDSAKVAGQPLRLHFTGRPGAGQLQGAADQNPAADQGKRLEHRDDYQRRGR